MIDTKNMNPNELSTATRENMESLGYGLRTIQMVNSSNGKQHLERLITVSWQQE